MARWGTGSGNTWSPAWPARRPRRGPPSPGRGPGGSGSNSHSKWPAAGCRRAWLDRIPAAWLGREVAAAMVQPETQGLGQCGRAGVVVANSKVAAGRATTRTPGQECFAQSGQWAGSGRIVRCVQRRKADPPCAVRCVGHRRPRDGRARVGAEHQLAVDDGGKYVNGNFTVVQL